MTEQNHLPANQVTIESHLFRFISSICPQGAWFDLKDGVPPEKYVSFFSGSGVDTSNRVCDAIFQAIGRYTPAPSGNAAEMFVPKVLETVNRRKEIVRFHQAGAPHYGMTYISQDNRDILFAKTVLCSIAESNMTAYGHCESLTASIEHRKAQKQQRKQLASQLQPRKSGGS